MQAMLLYPDAQRFAQEQIDKVVGADRMPTMDDEPKLPYVRSLMKETLSAYTRTPGFNVADVANHLFQGGCQLPFSAQFLMLSHKMTHTKAISYQKVRE